MLVYGKNVLRELLNSDTIINKVILSDNFNDKELINLINKKKLNLSYDKKDKLDKLCYNNSQGVIIYIKDDFYVDFKDILNDKNSNFIVILDHIEDPHNFGAIIRTSECAGVDYIIIPNKGSVEVNSTVMKTSAGALTNSKICVVANLNNTIEMLKKNDYWVVGTDANGEDYTKINYEGKIALVIGSEGYGLKEMVRRNCDFIASIPMKGKVNSLNASVAAGIMIYEVMKTRK